MHNRRQCLHILKYQAGYYVHGSITALRDISYQCNYGNTLKTKQLSTHTGDKTTSWILVSTRQWPIILVYKSVWSGEGIFFGAKTPGGDDLFFKNSCLFFISFFSPSYWGWFILYESFHKCGSDFGTYLWPNESVFWLVGGGVGGAGGGGTNLWSYFLKCSGGKIFPEKNWKKIITVRQYNAHYKFQTFEGYNRSSQIPQIYLKYWDWVAFH